MRLSGHRAFSRVQYRYDALGRRTHKILHRHGEPDAEIMTFHWQGLQMVGEQSSRSPDRRVQYLYSEGSWEPLARVDIDGDSQQTFWYHTDLNGLPERLTDEEGDVVWRGQFSSWGETEYESGGSRLAVPQNLRFQGQYLDRETGLHYNLFRYYDPVMGRFTQPDPIGLAGGLNLYAYAPNPLSYIDPLGLSSSPAEMLIRKLRALQKAQGNAVDVRSLPDGRIRYYDLEVPARTPGPTRGRSHVTEWNSSTGGIRSWEETYDHSGKVNRVHPKMRNGEVLDLPHYPPTKADLDAGKSAYSGKAIKSGKCGRGL